MRARITWMEVNDTPQYPPLNAAESLTHVPELGELFVVLLHPAWFDILFSYGVSSQNEIENVQEYVCV
jgi:hypothetical protein